MSKSTTGPSFFDSAVNEPMRTPLSQLDLEFYDKNDGIDEGAYADDDFDDEADLTK
jgi:hypothetical protein